MLKILFVCHGNICRSTMAQSIMTYLVNKENLKDSFEIDSAATSREEIGNGIHYGTVNVLKNNNIPVIPHRAKQITKNDYEYFDFLIGMDSENKRNLKRFYYPDEQNKVFNLLDFTELKRDILDPWYTGDFDTTFSDVLLGCSSLLKSIKKTHLNK